MACLSAVVISAQNLEAGQEVIHYENPGKLEGLKEKREGHCRGNDCTPDGRGHMAQEKDNMIFYEELDNSSGFHNLAKRSPKVLSKYAALWSKKLIAAGFIYPPPLSWYFKASGIFDKKLAKALFKVPIVGRKKRSPKVLSAYAAGFAKFWKATALLTKPIPPISKYFKFAATVDGTLAKLLFKVPIVGRKKRSSNIDPN